MNLQNKLILSMAIALTTLLAITLENSGTPLVPRMKNSMTLLF